MIVVRKLAVLSLLAVGCAAPRVVTRSAPEVFSVEAGARMAAQCAEELPLAAEQCDCMARVFVGQPIRMAKDEIQALVDKAWAKCVGPEALEGQVSL